MVIPAYVEIRNHQKKKLANDDLVNDAVFVAINIPVTCELIRTLIEKLAVDRKEEEVFDGATESFLFQLKYLAQAIKRDIGELHQSLIDTGHKEMLYYQE